MDGCNNNSRDAEEAHSREGVAQPLSKRSAMSPATTQRAPRVDWAAGDDASAAAGALCPTLQGRKQTLRTRIPRLFTTCRLRGVIIIALIGCREDQIHPTQVERSQSVSRSVGGRPAHIRGAEQAFADLAAAARSSAGYYFDHDARLVLQVRDSADFSAARAAASQLLARSAIATDRLWKGAVAVRQAKYTFYELASWRDSVFEHVLGQFGGVTSLDMNEEENRVVIGLDPALENTLR